MDSLQEHAKTDKAIRLVEYLLRLASLRGKLVRDVSEYSMTLWISDIPHETGCFAQAWGRDDDYDSDVWVEIQNRREPELPSIPNTCEAWADRLSLRNKRDLPALLTEIARQVRNPAWREGTEQPEYISQRDHIVDHPEVQSVWDQYIEKHWLPWVEEHNTWESIHKVYSSLFAIHQEQLRLGEEYELVLGLGLLTWETPNGQRVRRHLIVASAQLEFEARLAKFTVRPNSEGARLRPELDMLDVEEQPVHAEEIAKAPLANAGDDPWERACIEGVLQGLVHSIKSEGEYDGTLAPKGCRASAKPGVEYAPALILRKRSAKGLTETLKRIREKIESGEEIPPEFQDLSEIRPNDASPGLAESDPGQVDGSLDGEIFFPKPANEGQRRIVQRVRGSSGVLVQGPPGTGKSHTIANLVCHLLATGQRTLITAKTPRALQVLEGLIHPELRPLCINLLGSGLEEKRSLEASVGGILRKNEEWNSLQTHGQMKENERKLRYLREEKAKVERRLRSIREAESHVQSIAEGAYRGTAAQIARAVNRDSSDYGWFTDTVASDSTCPVSDSDLCILLAALRHFTPDKRQELDLSWPHDTVAPEEFARLVECEKAAIQQETAFSEAVNGIPRNHMPKGDAPTIENLAAALEAFRDARHRLLRLRYVWMQDAVSDVIGGKPSVWRELSALTRESIDSIEAAVHVADDTTIGTPDGVSVKMLLDDIRQLRDHVERGGSLGWWLFRPKLVKKRIHVLRGIRVNGGACRNIEDFTLLADVLHVRLESAKIWGIWRGQGELPQGPYTVQVQSLKALQDALEAALYLETRMEQCREALKQCHVSMEPIWEEDGEIDRLISSCRLVATQIARERTTQEIRRIETPVVSACGGRNAHPIVPELLEAIRHRSIDGFTRACARIQALTDERRAIGTMYDERKRLRRIVPKLMEKLEGTCDDGHWDTRLPKIQGAWNWARAKFWVEEYIRQEDSVSLGRRAAQIDDEINGAVANLAALHAWSFCFSRLREDHRRHMEAWQQSIRRLGKGTGKHAYRHRREAQEHLNECREAVPAWVMPLHRIWDTVDAAPALFDVIIIDEASQCGFEAIPLLYLAKKILIVGDDKQISPEEGFIDKNAVFQLMEQFLYDFKFKDSFHRDASLFDHGKRMYGTRRVVLREHFRCMPEIIRFSNDLCYSDTPLIPLRQYGRERLTPVERVFVEGGYREGSGNRVVNRPEAEAVAEKIVELCQDPRYSDKTMGVVVLQGDAQASLIEHQLLEQLGAEEMEKRRLICGNPYTFQGDERDIIFLSMVAAPNERIGPLTKAADVRRFNVAASRARDQIWLFHSVTTDDLSTTCLRRRLLEFFQHTKAQEIAGVDRNELERRALQDNRSIVSPPTPFDSWFEVDVALEIARRDFTVIPQHEVGGKRIDMVVFGPGANGLAIECDGDEWHGADRYEADMDRQRVLERCKWEFFRVRESAFYSNKEVALERLWLMLDERGITASCGVPNPEPQLAAISNDSVTARADSECTPTQDMTQPLRVSIGSTVVYVNETDGSQCQALISSKPSNPEWGTVNAETPIARALLGAQAGQVVTAHLPVGSVNLRIIAIL